MTAPCNDNTAGPVTATLTKNELFERFLECQRIRKGMTTYTQEDYLDSCEAALGDQPSNLLEALCESDDPEWELGEIADQIMGCARDLKDVFADFKAFIAQHEQAGGRVMTRVCIRSTSGSPICGLYEERDGMVHVHFDGRKKSTEIGNLYAEHLAATILREMAVSAA